MRINLISAIGKIPTSYPFEGYGGIERIVADLAHVLSAQHEVTLIGSSGSQVKDCMVKSSVSEHHMMLSEKYEGITMDFSHLKLYQHPKYSIPMFSDAQGSNPIYPTKAVRNAFGDTDGKVIYPGIDLSGYYTASKEDYFIVLGRIMPLKGIDMSMYYAKVAGIKHLKIIGHTGKYSDMGQVPESSYLSYLKGMGDGMAEFIADVSEKDKRELLAHAKGMIFTPNWGIAFKGGIESFGITTVEAMASGTPVFISSGAGGCNELLTDGTGKNMAQADWKNLMGFYDQYAEDVYTKKCISHATDNFSAKRYASELLKYIGETGKDV